MNPNFSKRWAHCIALRASALLLLFTPPLAAQEAQPSSPPAQKSAAEIQVNWLYGAFVPKGIPLTSLTNSQRGKLYLSIRFQSAVQLCLWPLPAQ